MRCSTVPVAARPVDSRLRYADPQRRPSVLDRASNCLVGTRSDVMDLLAGTCMIAYIFPFCALSFDLFLRWGPHVHRELGRLVSSV